MDRADQKAAMSDRSDFHAVNSFIGSPNTFSRGMRRV